jgi:hypothetical protein
MDDIARFFLVMAGLVSATYGFSSYDRIEDVDARHTAGHDG